MTGPNAAAGDEAQGTPRADLHDAIAWTLLGLVTLIGSIRMDRLEQQGINPVTIPGLLPGLLGLAMMALGLVLGLRSWRRGARQQAVAAPDAHARAQRVRVAVAIALCCGYAVVLVGHGLHFWVASAIYVTASILVFRWLGADPAHRRLGVWPVAQALLIGVASSVVIWLVFEQLFLVRLP